MIRISVVSYLNSRPFVYGLKNFRFTEEIEITEDIPSLCADKLINGNADIGLVPVAALLKLPHHEIISEYCIGSEGDVKSVLLLSNVPLNEIKKVLLDYQSRTSILLTKILFREFWNHNPEFEDAKTGFENSISGTTAGVVIGDRALEIKDKFSYVYDLSAEWKKMTSLPFVFACWVSTKKLSENFIREFNSALSNGLSEINQVAENEKSSFLSSNEIKNYLKNNINYNFDTGKKEALKRFLKYAETV